MVDTTTRGWALRLAELVGVPPEEITEEHLARLVAGAVPEDADLDFKQERYGNSDSAKRDLAGDIAAMGNSRGGVIIIGIRDEDDVATELTPVELDSGEEGRIRQIAASNIAPHLTFGVCVVRSEREASKGYYLLIVPPSTLTPHAVRQDRNLRFPRRDGTTTRWLSEPEVADAYRNRFRIASEQTGRVEQILTGGLEVMNLDGDAFVALAIVPTEPGSLTIDLAQVASIQHWASSLGPPNFFDGFFPAGVSPTAGVGAHRMTLTSLFERQQPNWQYAELFDDGAGFACQRLMDPRAGSADREHSDAYVLNEALLWGIGRCLHLVGQHAVQHCGAWGDAVVEARVVGNRMQLAYMHRIGGFGSPEPIAGGRERNEAVSRHTIVLEAAATVGQALSAAVRLVATDLFQTFGSPEVRQIAPDGALRARYLSADRELQAWAEEHGIDVSNEAVPGE